MEYMELKLYENVGRKLTWVFDVGKDGYALYRKGIKCADEECDRYAEGLQIGSWPDEIIPTMDVSPVCVEHKYTDAEDTTSGLVFIHFPEGHSDFMRLFR